MTESSSGADLLNRLAHEFAERYRQGERPALSEYTDKFPDLAADIRELFPALVVMEQFGQHTGPDSKCVKGDGPIPQQLGEYRILREVARGGMGIVYEAVQEPLGRHVALKVLPFQSLATGHHLERFQREARAAANLHHTNIVPVFGVGEHQGLHYYAMQFIQGQSLDNVLRELRRLRRDKCSDSSSSRKKEPTTEDGLEGQQSFSLAAGLLSGQFEPSNSPSPPTRCPGALPRTEKEEERVGNDESKKNGESKGVLSASTDSSLTLQHSTLSSQTEQQYFRTVARLGVQVAEALAYAHGQGVLHRDIKPSNLLLDTQGTAWITDFGLAKAADSDDLTGTGDLIGTFRYMAPERFQGQADARSDVYGLGITLYEMLTLQPAHVDSNRARLIERILHEEPVRPRKLDYGVPRDLETIVLKALAKEPAGRYHSASELAEDLRRFLADRPIEARSTSFWERGVKWCKRRPALAGLVAVSVVAVLAMFGLSVGLWESARLQRVNSGLTEARHDLEVTNDALNEANQEKDVAYGKLTDALVDVRKGKAEAEFQRQRAQEQESVARSYL